jgi:hypothetical protein
MRRRRSSSSTSALVALAILSLAACIPIRAAADETRIDVGLTLNPIIGTHQSFNDFVHVPPVPLPLVEVHVRNGPLEFEAFGLPALVSAYHNDPVQGQTYTRLSIFDGTFRYYVLGRRVSFGLGETLYNQSTHYADAVEIPGTGETQYSRVAGVHYELGYHLPWRRGGLDITMSLTPALHGTQFTAFDVTTFRPRINPEKGAQVDADVRYIRPLGPRRDFILGMRYLNYTTHYDQRNGTLADRNTGFLPSVGLRFRI